MTKTNYEKTKKILFLGFLVFVFLAISNPFKTEADSLINWKNPNADGGGPFRLSGDNILEIIQEEGLITQVIGCTGVIDKVAGVLYDLESIGSALLSNPKDTINLLFSEKARAKACRSTKGAAETAVGGTPQMTLPPGLELIIDCGPYANEGSSPKTDQKLEDLKKQEEKKKFTQDCLNGIAFTLAKNQLTSMARSTMNWINAGLDGNPYFVQATRSVLNSVERNIVEPAILGLSDKAFPYGDTFVLSYVNRFRNTNNMTIDRGLLGNLASNMADYIIVDYREDPDLSPLENKQAMEKKAIEKFSQDFSSGGWDGWAAMILGDKNNPLGFYSAASRAISRKVEEATQDVRDEIEQGYLNQTECVKWQTFDENGEPVKKDIRISGLSGNVAVDIEYHTYPGPQRSPYDTEKNDVCVQTKVITPAAHIKAKAEEILQTPTRQLELADNINSVLNSVFSVLLYALQNQGLPGLASGDYNYSTDSAVTSTISNEVGSDSSLNANNSNYTKDGSFDITRDLGNTFIYEYNENSFLGYWDANTNTIISEQPASGNCFNDEGNEVRCPTTLMKKKAPYCEGEDGSKINCGANFYYIVSNPGKADIIQNSYNTWAKGDRAFWDGSSWQNWKCQGGGFDMKGECTIQKNPIKNRGVLQLQEDYKIVAKEMLAILPSLMGKIGELDYCIPGPNPSWEINAGEPYVKLIEIANSISADYDSSGSKIKKETRYHFPSEGEDLFEDYRSLFRTLDGHEGVLWTKIKETSKKWEELQQPAKIGMFPWKDKNTDQDEIADEMVSRLSNSVTREVENFFKKYDEFIDAHFGILTQEFIEKEDTAKLEKNPHFIPMMKAGLEITSGMLYYDEEVKTLTKKYEDDLQDANSNIYKLSEIKNEVSEIIEAAQKRRTASMIEKIKEEEGLSDFSEQDFYDRYKECLDEENVKFYEDLDLTDNSGGEEERCSDGIDNDRDGYIDSFDPDCNNRGFSSRAVTEKYNWGPDTNIDSIEVVWHELDCGPDVFECKNGALVENSKIETDLLYKWTCLSDRGEEKHCKRNLDLTWNGALEQIGILINDLGDGQINWDAIEYIVAFYEQKALTTDLNWSEEQFKNILDWVLDFRGAATVVGGVIGGALNLLNMLTPVLTALGI